MEFNTISYLILLFSILVLKVLLPEKFKIPLLIFGSFVFIASKNIESLIVLICLSTLNYFLAKNIAFSNSKKKVIPFYLGILFNLSALFLFKYFEQNTQGLSFSFTAINFESSSFIFLIGLSFYTLQNIAYLIEVYHNRTTNNISWINYIFYSSFFPKIVSGPIILPQEFLTQIHKERSLSSDIKTGAQRLIIGLFKKMVIADRLAPYVHYNFDLSDTNNGLTALVALYFFTFQLYFDFSGYTDMAIGSAKMLGIDIKENFQFPLRAASVTDFWRRWHISLTSWLTKYVFYPLSYHLRNLKITGTLLAITVTFIISGLWHGLGFNFLLYALCHALYLCIELITKKSRARFSNYFSSSLNKLIGIIITFNLISLSFIFFRAKSLDKSFSFLNSIFSFNNFLPSNWLNDFVSKLAIGGDLESQFNLYITLALTILFLIFEKKIVNAFLTERFKWRYAMIFILMIFLFGIFKSREQFIYIQF